MRCNFAGMRGSPSWSGSHFCARGTEGSDVCGTARARRVAVVAGWIWLHDSHCAAHACVVAIVLDGGREVGSLPPGHGAGGAGR